MRDKEFFESAKEAGTIGMFMGHLHRNSCSVVWEGIRMTMGRKTGSDTFYYEDSLGGTLVPPDCETGAMDVAHVYQQYLRKQKLPAASVFLLLPPYYFAFFRRIAFCGQASMQFPQRRQCSCRMAGGTEVKSIQPCGQTASHARQTAQASVIKYPSDSACASPKEKENRSIGFWERSNQSPLPA